MNAEIIKAMNRKEKSSIFNEWWDRYGYKIMRVILFPIWFTLLGYEKIQEWLNSRNSWDEVRVNEILNYYIPRRAKWNNKDKSFYFFDNGMGWSVSCVKKYLKRKDRRFWDNHSGWLGGRIRSYLINEFELEGFTKEVFDCSNSWTEIIFTMIEK